MSSFWVHFQEATGPYFKDAHKSDPKFIEMVILGRDMARCSFGLPVHMKLSQFLRLLTSDAFARYGVATVCFENSGAPNIPK